PAPDSAISDDVEPSALQSAKISSENQVEVNPHRFSQNLGFGDTGMEVAAWQTFLEENGYPFMPKGVPKGNYGYLTEKVTAKFQKDHNLKDDGIVGPITRTYVNKSLFGQAPLKPSNLSKSSEFSNKMAEGATQVTIPTLYYDWCQYRFNLLSRVKTNKTNHLFEAIEQMKAVHAVKAVDPRPMLPYLPMAWQKKGFYFVPKDQSTPAYQVCLGKSLLIMEVLAGDPDIQWVIGQHRNRPRRDYNIQFLGDDNWKNQWNTHCWAEGQYNGKRYILDPSFHAVPILVSEDGTDSDYIPLYGANRHGVKVFDGRGRTVYLPQKQAPERERLTLASAKMPAQRL